MNIRPLHDRVIIKRLEAESKSAGGVHYMIASSSSVWKLRANQPVVSC